MTGDQRGGQPQLGARAPGVPLQRGAAPADRLAELAGGLLGDRPQQHAELTEQGELWPDLPVLDAVRCTEAVFPQLAAEGRLPAVLRTVAATLREGGVLVAAVPEFGERRPSAPPPRVVTVDGIREMTAVVWDWAPDGESYQLELVRLRCPGGAWELVDTVTTRHAVLRPQQVHALLTAAGFTDVRRIDVGPARYPVPVWVAALPRS